jgi:N-acyl-D-amino-acid deacylase
LGFSTSRTIVHRAVDGEPVPGTFAAEDELFGIGQALASLGTESSSWRQQVRWAKTSLLPSAKWHGCGASRRRSCVPISFALLQVDSAPDQWREILRLAAEANAEGADLRPQVAGRALNILLGFQTFHPFSKRPSYLAIADLPLDERIQHLRKDEVRRAILSEKVRDDPLMAMIGGQSTKQMFPLGEPPDYEPTPDMSVAAIAVREGRAEEEVLYDLMLRHDGRELVLFTIGGYSHGSLDDMKEMLLHPNSALGLSDGGAHCGVICDASAPTFMLSHWARDRADGLPLEFVVKKMTRDTAHLYGLEDRGVIAPASRPTSTSSTWST